MTTNELHSIEWLRGGKTKVWDTYAKLHAGTTRRSCGDGLSRWSVAHGSL